jgi:hypothetical protein
MSFLLSRPPAQVKGVLVSAATSPRRNAVITPLDSRDRSRRQLVKAGSSLTPTRNRLGLARTGTPARDSDGFSPRLESKSAKAKKANPFLPGEFASLTGPGIVTRRQTG